VATRAQDDMMENIMKLNNKLPVEFQVVLVKGCLAKDRQLKSHNDVRKWIVDNANVVL
jgi:tRNA A37 methylthiotransferase MiaB